MIDIKYVHNQNGFKLEVNMEKKQDNPYIFRI